MSTANSAINIQEDHADAAGLVCSVEGVDSAAECGVADLDSKVSLTNNGIHMPQRSNEIPDRRNISQQNNF